MLDHVVDAAMSLKDVKLHIVVVMAPMPLKHRSHNCHIIEQTEQLNAAHAVSQALQILVLIHKS